MPELIDNLRDDISFLRTVAEAGQRNRPILGGAMLAAAGAIFGGAAFLQWALTVGRIATGAQIGALWIGALALYVVAWIALFLRLRIGKAASGTSSRIFGMTWFASGLGICASEFATAIIARRLQNPMPFIPMAAIVLSFYGVAWLICAGTSRKTWMYVVASASFAFTIVLALLPVNANLPLAFAFAIVALVFVPGICLMLQEPR